MQPSVVIADSRGDAYERITLKPPTVHEWLCGCCETVSPEGWRIRWSGEVLEWLYDDPMLRDHEDD